MVAVSPFTKSSFVMGACLSTSLMAGGVLHSSLHQLDQNAWFQLNPNHSVLNRSAVSVYVLLDEQIPIQTAREAIQQAGGAIRDEFLSLKGLVVEWPRSNLDSLADIPGVRWVEPALPPLTISNDDARECNEVEPLHHAPWSLQGEGEVVVLIEPDSPASHPDLTGRLSVGCSELGGHATHVAGIIAGSGSVSSGQYRGMAPLVGIDAYCLGGLSDYLFYSSPGTIEDIYVEQLSRGGAASYNQSLGINVEVNGYPCWLMGEYGVTSSLLDHMVRGSLGSPVVSVWAAGNERGGVNCSQQYGSVSPPGCAKNVITVGAVYSDTSNPAWFSSFGPTNDGRLKPDVVAAGAQIGTDGGTTSCAIGGGYEVRSGTSMATPVVSGVIALMSEGWHRITDSIEPLPSTYKAILCHTAEDRGSTGPDYRTGWGLVDAHAAVEAMVQSAWVETQLAPGETSLIQLELGSHQVNQPLKITLAWDDQASLPDTGVGLVNDIDLLLMSPTGTLHYPWSLDPNDPEGAAVRTAGDDLNTVEQVLVDVPEEGMWLVFVSAKSENSSTQSASIVGTEPVPVTLISIGDLPSQFPLASDLEVEVTIEAIGEELLPGSELLFYKVDQQPYQSTPLHLDPVSGKYLGVIPSIPCETTVSFYAQVESTLTGINEYPINGAAAPLELTAVVEEQMVFYDSFEIPQAWTIEGNAVVGNWHIGLDSNCTPPGLSGDDYFLATGNDFIEGCEDIDGGITTAISPPIQLFGTNPGLSYYRYVQNSDCPAPVQDPLLVEYSVDDGVNWFILESLDCGSDNWPYWGWGESTFDLGDFPDYEPTSTFRLKFTASDLSPDHLVHIGVDRITLLDIPCGPEEPDCPADIANDDNIVDVDDLLLLLWYFGLEYAPADFNQNGLVDIDDLLTMIAAYSVPCP